MNRIERKKLIDELFELLRKGESVVQSLYGVIGSNPDGPLQQHLYALNDFAVKSVAEDIGDTGGWLDWFVFENEFGERKLSAGYGDASDPICSVDDLINLMEKEDASKPVEYRLLNDGEIIEIGDELFFGLSESWKEYPVPTGTVKNDHWPVRRRLK